MRIGTRCRECGDFTPGLELSGCKECGAANVQEVWGALDVQHEIAIAADDLMPDPVTRAMSADEVRDRLRWDRSVNE